VYTLYGLGVLQGDPLTLIKVTASIQSTGIGCASRLRNLSASCLMWKLATFVLLLPLATMAFEPPSTGMRRAAVGDLSPLPPLLKRAFALDSPDLQPIPKPGPHDWLALHREPGQTFDDFKALRPMRPTSTRRLIYLQPLGYFPPEGSPSIAKLRDFAAAFFAMEVTRVPREASFMDEGEWLSRQLNRLSSE
jgi:archaemetzincin